MPDITLFLADEPSADDFVALTNLKVMVNRRLSPLTLICAFPSTDLTALTKLAFVVDAKPYDPSIIINPGVASSARNAVASWLRRCSDHAHQMQRSRREEDTRRHNQRGGWQRQHQRAVARPAVPAGLG